jgi:ActR/RegA family two-component response regulator
MDEARLHDPDAAPTRPPVDSEVERGRLRRDAAARGIDPDAAEQVGRRVALAQPLAAAYRAIDRRLATGYTLAEAEGLATGAIEDPHAGRAGPSR